MKNDFKIIVLGLIFEFSLFQPLWSKYVVGKISYENVNFFGSITLFGISILIISSLLYYLKKFNYTYKILVYVFFSTLFSLVILSYIGYEINKNKTYKIEPIGFDSHKMYFAGLWLKEEFKEDHAICLNQNLNFYYCFEGLETSPWLYPDFYKNLLFFIIAVILSLVFVLAYTSRLLINT